MRYELKEFQDAAFCRLMDDMQYMMDGYIKHDHPGSCCLTAPTGSGKTVIAAAVVEALMEGSAESGYEYEADPDACVLWMTDLPSLAEQTRSRFLEATDLDGTRIESVTNTFTQNHDVLEPGKVYFMHRQLLGKGKLLTRGGETRTFWQLLRESIDSGLHLYLFLDEAHRGIGKGANSGKDDATIYAQLIDGFDGNTPMPVVVGISATPKRFLEAMKGRKNRVTTNPVTVSPADVQASGLLKDDIVLFSPKERTAADTIYLTRACKALEESTKLWGNWCAANGVDTVVPLMVVQVGDKVSDATLNELARNIQERLPNLGDDAFAHVFGDHEDRHLAGFYVPYVRPESVEEETRVRVLFAKEAISTGWDCPRAEVIYSMRKHSDITYIAQLIGRMVRTPLAMRMDIESLNSVSCYLPLFDEKAVNAVRDALTKEDAEDWSGISEDSGRHTYTNPVRAEWDDGLGEDVSAAFESIVKRVESHHPTNVILAALEYAGKLALYELDMTARKDVMRALLKELEDSIEIYRGEFEEAVRGTSNVTSVEVHFQYLDKDSTTSSTFTEAADKFAVANARARGDRAFTKALTNEFFRSEHEAGKGDMEINVEIAAAASVEDIVKKVQKKAEELLKGLMGRYDREVAQMPKPARDDFASVLSSNGIHRLVNLRRPIDELQDGDEKTYVKHVLIDPETGKAHLKLDGTEQAVVRTELRRGCVAFYRNPSSGIGEHVLTVTYQSPTGGHYAMHPDFVFFDRLGDGSVVPAIIDPHGEQYSDAIPKMRGLCSYAEEFGDTFSRIWSVDGAAERYVDLKDPDVRAFIRAEGRIDAGEVFEAHGKSYASK
jgi:superfamily II DNA or RNA helicase